MNQKEADGGRSARAARVRQIVAVALFCLLCGGCGDGSKFGDSDDIEQLRQRVKYVYAMSNMPIEILEVKLTDKLDVSEELFRLSFYAKGEVIRPSYVELDRAKVLASVGWNESVFNAAAEKARSLPPEEAANVAGARPIIDRETRFFRTEGEVGRKVEFTGKCVARWQRNHWTFTDIEMTPTTPEVSRLPASMDLNNLRFTVLPANGFLFTPEEGAKRLADVSKKLQDYVAAVEAAQQRVAAREERILRSVRSVAKPGTSWTAYLPDGNRPPQQWVLDFVNVENDTQALKVLVRHPTDELRRRVYAGVVAAPSSANPGGASAGPRRDAQIILEPLDDAGNLFQMGAIERITIVYDDALGTLRLRTNFGEGTLKPYENATPVRTEADVFKDLVQRLRPGMQWNGQVKTGLEAAERVRLTFVEYKDDGNYVRAVAESPDDPFTVVVYEGIVNRNGLLGRPIVLQAIDAVVAEREPRDFFSVNVSPTLTLMPKGAGLVGVKGRDQVELGEPRLLEPWARRDKLVGETFAAGVALTGRLRRGDDSREVQLTIAEIRDDGGYVRAVGTSKEDPYDCVVFEGRLPLKSGLIDGYALQLTQRRDELRQNGLFSEMSNPMLRLRLALDGKSVLGIITNGPGGRVAETVMLAVDPQRRAPRSLATKEFAEVVRQAVRRGTIWKGSLRDVEQAATAELILQVTETRDDGSVTMKLTSPRVPGAFATFAGLLQLDDLNVNAHQIVLRKTLGGKASASLTFDSETGEDRKLKLKLSPDGTTLHGLIFEGNYRDARTEELVVTLSGGANAGGTGPSAPSGLLKPVAPTP